MNGKRKRLTLIGQPVRRSSAGRRRRSTCRPVGNSAASKRKSDFNKKIAENRCSVEKKKVYLGQPEGVASVVVQQVGRGPGRSPQGGAPQQQPQRHLSVGLEGIREAVDQRRQRRRGGGVRGHVGQGVDVGQQVQRLQRHVAAREVGVGRQRRQAAPRQPAQPIAVGRRPPPVLGRNVFPMPFPNSGVVTPPLVGRDPRCFTNSDPTELDLNKARNKTGGSRPHRGS